LRHTLDFIGYLQLFPDNDQQGAIVLPPVKRVNFHKTVLQCCLFAEIDMSRLRQQFQYRELQNYQNHNDTIEVSWQRKIAMVPSGSDEFDEKAPTRFDAFRGAPDIRF